MVILFKAPLSLQHIAILLWLALMVLGHVDSQTTRSSKISCVDTERLALLSFKKSLVFSLKHPRLSNWRNENMDCCRWEGIQCSKAGHVVTLDLHKDNDEACLFYGECIRGEISSSLLHLPYLNYLDLSNNNFTKVPDFLGSLKRLRYLNLSRSHFTGIVPHQLGNLSVLETLDLSENSDLEVDSFAWVLKLTSLKYLDLSGLMFSQTVNIDWCQSFSKLPHLTNLYLTDHRLCQCPTPTELNASTSLEVLDLTWTSLAELPSCLNASMDHPTYGPIPDFLSKLVSIKHLYLSNTFFEGSIPESFSNLSNLLTLDLSGSSLTKSSGFLQSGSTSLRELRVDYNLLRGHLPNFSKFPSLQVLNLAGNKFVGSLAQLLWQSPNLSTLDVSSNQLYGIVTEAHFQNLSNLKVLSLSMNSVTLNFSTSVRPQFQLHSLNLRDCKVGERFPLWLRRQENLIFLDISNSGISDVVPSWFWNISSRLQFFNVSHNSIAGTIPPTSLASCKAIILSFNRFHGPVPTFSRELDILDMSSNTFSGGISFLCGLLELRYLDLSNNLLSGALPNCWEQVRNLWVINLNNNNFTGFLPNSMGSLDLVSLRLRNNRLSGPVPQSMSNCSGLFILDLGENQFSGSVPEWIGTSLGHLKFLRLNSNKFAGKVPSSLCSLENMNILDLSFNNISGTIPSCLYKIKSMSGQGSDYGLRSLETSIESGDLVDTTTDDFTAWVFWKGLQLEFTSNIKLLTLIDLSSNGLSGFIPGELTYLYELVSLNLSHNALFGPIPDKIGEMRMLEMLDLSGNQLSGEIPRSMSKLTTLSYLDLSYNNLTGSIPISTQLQSFNATMFRGNLGLCGAPLPNSCHQGDKNVDYDLTNIEGEDGMEKLWMYMSIGLGFMVGFWGVCGPLIVKNSWRQKYFQVLKLCKERILVAVFIGLARLRRRFAA